MDPITKILGKGYRVNPKVFICEYCGNEYGKLKYVLNHQKTCLQRREQYEFEINKKNR